MLLQARLHLTFRMFQISLFVVSVMNFESFKDFFFAFLPSSKSTTRNTKLVRNTFIRPTLFNFFKCFVLYFQSHFMILPFCGHFCCVSHQQSNSNKFKDLKTFEYYGIWIETFELTTEEYRRLKKLDSEAKIRITWWKIRPEDPNICSI